MMEILILVRYHFVLKWPPRCHHWWYCQNPLTMLASTAKGLSTSIKICVVPGLTSIYWARTGTEIEGQCIGRDACYVCVWSSLNIYNNDNWWQTRWLEHVEEKARRHCIIDITCQIIYRILMCGSYSLYHGWIALWKRGSAGTSGGPNMGS